MPVREIVAFLDAASDADSLLRTACDVTRRQGAYLVASYVPSDEFLKGGPGEYARGGAVESALDDFAAATERARTLARKQFSQHLAAFGVAGEWRDISEYKTASDIVIQARYADLSVVAGTNDGGTQLWKPEDILFASGGPVLIVPPTTRQGRSIGKRVLLAWDASREARRALSDALPFLAEAEAVMAVIVDPRSDMAALGEEPAMALARYLARHGVPIEVRSASSAESDVGSVILDQANTGAADLIVMGGYGQSKFVELVLGGATRTVLKHSHIPVLMSH